MVTGAGSGIGKASALALMAEGYATVLAGRRVEPIEAVAAEGRAAGYRPGAFSFTVSGSTGPSLHTPLSLTGPVRSLS